MNQIVYEIVVFLHLMGYHDSKLKLLINMYQDKLEIESEALINILESIITDLKNKNYHESIISNIYDFIELINKESQY